MNRAIATAIVFLTAATVTGCRRDESELTSRVKDPVAAAACVERYSTDTLRRREFAFEGIVVSDESQTAASITFQVVRWFKGEQRTSVTLQRTAAADSLASVDMPAMSKNARYLVAGDGSFLWGCGFTREYSGAEARVWAETLSG